jgi:hypothetical protein
MTTVGLDQSRTSIPISIPIALTIHHGAVKVQYLFALNWYSG